MRKSRNKKPHTIGIIGGSGFCRFPELGYSKLIWAKTKYGYPSDKIILGRYKGVDIAFLPRHGSFHHLPPHKVPYKANIMALREINVSFIIGFCAVGSLNPKLKPGDFVVLDQFVNFTWGRDDYFSIDKSFAHLPMDEPYSKAWSSIIYKAGKLAGIKIHKSGTAVVIQGPRFNTIAESQWFKQQKWDVISMTQYPESYFAREAKLHYAGIAMITDYDIGLHKKDETFTNQIFAKHTLIFKNNVIKAKKLIGALDKLIKEEHLPPKLKIDGRYYYNF